MLKHREIRLSIRDRLSTLLGAPPAASGLSAFNVYTEAQFRDDTFAPTFPFVYLLDSYVLPVKTKLPLVIIEIGLYRRQTFEIGNRSGRFIRVHIHVFGRNRAERDDLAALVADYFGSTFTIKQYPENTAVETVQLSDRIDVEDMAIANEEVQFGGAVLDWSRVTFTFETKL